MTAQTEVEAVAKEVITSLSNHSQIPTFSSRPGGLVLTQAYRVIPQLRAAFEAHGEKIAGRKIGFTNRQTWKALGVGSPIWEYTTSRTTRELTDMQVEALDDFSEPRIEPEIMFGLGLAPAPTMSDSALVDCVEWVALGYEIVQSIFPNWQFSAANTVAANGVHGALRHLVELLANDPHNPPLCAGEVISTGTLTLAMPVKPCECWTTTVVGIPLEEITIRFG
jgi:2-oxo-3-hexenedioate decarboxylase